MARLKVRPEAELEALEAASWYDGERAGLGMELLGELRATFARIEEGPQRFPVVFREFRRAILHRFPEVPHFPAMANPKLVNAIANDDVALRRDSSISVARCRSL